MKIPTHERLSYSDYLYKPFLEPLTTEEARLKRFVMTLSMLAIFLFSGFSEVSFKDLSLAGVSFAGLSNSNIAICLLILVIYTVIHYNWSIWSHWLEHKLRLSGLRVYSDAHETQKIISGLKLTDPGVNERRQSTLMSWWRGQDDALQEIVEIKDSIMKQVETVKNAHISEAKKLEQKLEANLKQYQLMTDMLAHFGKGFWHFQKQQSLKFLLFDLLTPNLLAILALIFLARTA